MAREVERPPSPFTRKSSRFDGHARRGGKPLKGWTIRGAVSALSGIFSEAVDQELLASNPVQKISRRKREKVNDETPKRVLTVDEIETLIETARQRGPRWAAFTALGIYAGLRIGEALGLVWKDVDLEAGVIRVRKQRDSKTGALRDLKSDSSRRNVPISTPLRRASSSGSSRATSAGAITRLSPQ